MTRMCTIYRITNTVTGMFYIGQTWKTPQRRLRGHINDAVSGCGHCTKLVRAIRKYGAGAFTIEAIASAATQADADFLESHIISETGCIAAGYNLRGGGSHGALSEETKAKMRLCKTGKAISQETRAKISATLTGRKNGPPSEATREKISKAHTGSKRSDETRAKLSAIHTGKPLSPEHRAAQSRGRTGIRRTEGAKKNQSEGMRLAWKRRKANGDLGKASDETRRKMSDSQNARFRNMKEGHENAGP